jgi:hypothetical protein
MDEGEHTETIDLEKDEMSVIREELDNILKKEGEVVVERPNSQTLRKKIFGLVLKNLRVGLTREQILKKVI